ncbi:MULTISPECIES: nitrile hydratase accessory protein [unclassified Paenibacillus]|uniref:nitrile hydratase accessory protein n=1 Tax=unclassified Paenibacillus TaxID=185978 RepID=UPI001AE9CDB2|nr:MULTISPECIES: nitrile hydratase accessory protein [unclassified Paenibacillus]MBP1154146.1 nitrile hydratase [Paenibacillus sp. PvP091]MBP1170469.1 nitrile hydratase [Paenibacillus sp. PvR098]MBP2441497.1 nitrile hydratase [Paenibacillus sp. PvP052]
MSQDTQSIVRTIEEKMNMPRENGELVFRTPWEGRIFAMAVLLMEKGIYPWKTFNGKFVEEIGEAEQEQPGKEIVSAYYQHWVQAFEKVLMEKEVLTKEQLQSRTHEFKSGQRHHVC